MKTFSKICFVVWVYHLFQLNRAVVFREQTHRALTPPTGFRGVGGFRRGLVSMNWMRLRSAVRTEPDQTCAEFETLNFQTYYLWSHRWCELHKPWFNEAGFEGNANKFLWGSYILKKDPPPGLKGNICQAWLTLKTQLTAWGQSVQRFIALHVISFSVLIRLNKHALSLVLAEAIHGDDELYEWCWL